MTTEREAKILEGAIAKFGSFMQIDIAIEEMSELTKALIKDRRYCTAETMQAVKEEMADVGIMLNQLALIYGDCNEEEIAKLERLERLIEEDND